jgi:3-oxoacyl-[acyl-carrier-protein] synthase-3
VKPGVEEKIKAAVSRTVRPVAIAGTGSYVPERVLSNADLEKMVETTDEWITSRTGIRERRLAPANEASSDMAARAAEAALAKAGVKPEDVDLIIVATITPDMVFPSTACYVQSKIGAKKAFCFDLEAACSGFVYALDVARQFIATGSIETALVIGAEKISSITDWTDRSMCVLFGDGAGAAVLRPADGERGILSTVTKSDGTLAHLLMLPGGGSRNPASHKTVDEKLHFMKMDGREVFKHAITCMTSAAREALDRCGLAVEDVDCIIPHQANMRIIQAVADRIGGPQDKYYINVDRFGNTSAASVIVALDEAVRAGRIRKGDIVLLVAFGGGFTWGATVLEM